MQWYNRVITIFSLATSAMLGFSACEKEQENPGSGVQGSQGARTCSIYFGIDTGSAAQTRASGDFVDAENAEYAIGPSGNFAILFRKGSGDTTVYDGVYEMAFDTDQMGHGHKVDAIYKTVYNLESETIPTFECLVVLNAPWLYEKLSRESGSWTGKSKDEVLKLVWEDFDDPRNIGIVRDETTGKTYFTMTSSVYMDGNKKKDAVEISTSNIVSASDNAQTIQDKIVYVHVERMVSKFSFRFQNKSDERTDLMYFRPSEEADIVVFDKFDDSGSPLYVAKKWRIKVTGWNLNALEKTANLFKFINPGKSYFAGWSDIDNYRTYWEEDSHYTISDYPWQYRWAVDSDCIDYAQKVSLTANSNYLMNYSFNSLGLDGSAVGETVSEMSNSVIYVPANTYDAASVTGKLDNRDELLACTHLLIGAELQLETDDTPDAFEAVDLYRDRNGLYYRSRQACFASMMHAFNQLLTSQDVMEYTLYDWKKGGVNTSDDVVAKSAGGYSIYWDNREFDDEFLNEILNMSDKEFSDKFGSGFSPAPLRSGDGRLVPWLDSALDNDVLTIEKRQNGVRQSLEICKRVKDDLGAVTAGTRVRYANKDDIRSLLYEWLGSIDHFNNGKMYYAHGIDNPTSVDSDPERYGVIRNNWYQLNLKNISTIGVPVDDPDQPIVPERVGIYDKILVSIYVIDWHLEETYIEI